MGTELLAGLSGIASAIAIIIAATRKRRDVNVDEMNLRIERQTRRIEACERKIEQQREQLIVCEADNFALRRTLARHGLRGETDDVES